jgi:3-deoxy-manno-octulosonate cytidylyltransferase (CMP-KDO synthetase)
MKQVIVIPARYASVRLPGKPLLDIIGKPMIQRVYEQAMKADMEQTIVATDDQRIYDCLEDLGYAVCMTSHSHQSGTDRLAEVVEILGLNDDDIVINVQGDEPLIPVAVIKQVARLLTDHPSASMATLSTPLNSPALLSNPHVVKVISDVTGKALYFSRAPIPWHRDSNNHETGDNINDFPYQRHIGLYAYRAGFLSEFSQWQPCQLERVESLEQLRALWHGREIQVAEACEVVPEGIDTLEDLEQARAVFKRLKA